MKKVVYSVFLLVSVFFLSYFTATSQGYALEKDLKTAGDGVMLNVNCDSIKMPSKFGEYEDTGAEVADLASGVPSMTEATQSFIWRKNTDVVVNRDNSLDITRKLIAYIGESVPECYKFICIPVAKGSKLELIDAKIYDSRSGNPISLLMASPVNLEGGGFALMISATNEAIGRTIVITYKEHRAPSELISFYEEFADRQFPIWEQSLTIKTPKEIELYLDGLNSENPTKVEEADSTTYLWHTTNQLAVPENPFVEQHLSYVACSNKLGGIDGLKYLNNIFSSIYKDVKIPNEFKNMDFRALLAVVDDRNNTLPGIDQTALRDENVVPQKGPWTTWEKVAIITSYAEQLGAKVQFAYEACQDITDKSCAAKELFYLPILKITEKSGRVSYFAPISSACFDKHPPLVAGKVTYFDSNDKLKKKTLKSLKSASNHLDFSWNLKLDENGTSIGTLDIDYAGTWNNVLVDGVRPTKENIADFVKKAFTIAMPGLQLNCTGVSQKSSDRVHIDFDVKCQQAIVQGKHMLFRIPGGVPNALLAFNPTKKNYNFKFPFSINQTANVTIPAGYKLIQGPQLANTPAESSAFVVKQEFDYKSQWHRLELGTKLVVRLKDVTAEQDQFVGQHLAAVCRWGMTDVGFVRSEKAQERQEKIIQQQSEKNTQKKQNTKKNEPKNNSTKRYEKE